MFFLQEIERYWIDLLLSLLTGGFFDEQNRKDDLMKTQNQSKQHFSSARLLLSMLAIFIGGALYRPAEAMHIAEGFLDLKWSALWYIVALPFVFYGYKSLKTIIEKYPKAKILLAMAGAFTFILSALKIPSLTGSCSHPTGIALGAVLFGPAPMAIVGLIVLLFQALLLAHGGITTLGANLFSMGIAGAWIAYLTYKGFRKANASPGVSMFFAAFLGDLLTYVITAVQLAVAFPSATGGVAESLVKFMGVFAVTQLPIAVAEAFLSVIIFNIIIKYSTDQVTALDQEFGYSSLEQLSTVFAPEKTGKKLAKKNLILIVLTIFVAVFPLYVVKDGAFEGADGEAMDLVSQIRPDHEPIFEPLFEPASGEIESMLFALQAALGAGVIGYGIGRMTGKKET